MGEASEPTPRPNPANGNTVSGETLWSKDIDEYTEEDVEKILEIALKIRAEGVETGRRDLIDAYYMIGAFAELMKVYLLVKRMKARKAQKETSTQSPNP